MKTISKEEFYHQYSKAFNFMKKILLLYILIVALFIGCNNPTEKNVKLWNKWRNQIIKNMNDQYKICKDNDIQKSIETDIHIYEQTDSLKLFFLNFLEKNNKLKDNVFIIETTISGVREYSLYYFISEDKDKKYSVESYLYKGEWNYLKTTSLDTLSLLTDVNNKKFCDKFSIDIEMENVILSHFIDIKNQIVKSRYYNYQTVNPKSSLFRCVALE